MAMKRILALVLVLTSILAPMGHPAARAAAPSWQSVAGPSGGSVAALAMSPGYVNDHTVFAGLRGRGVYRTLDGGFSWQSAGLPDQVVIDLAISPAFAADRTIFAAVGLPTTGFNVYRSTDGGATWQPPFVTPDPNNFQSIIGLSISPNFASDHSLFVLGATAVYHSNDGGQTFFKSSGWYGTHHVTHLSFSPAYATDHTLFAAVQNDQLYKSTNSGSVWNPAGLSGDVSALAISPNYAADQMVAAITSSDGQLHVSMNQGASWTPGTLTLGVGGQHTLLFSPTFASDHLMLAASSNDPGAYHSTDSGAMWTPVGWYNPASSFNGGFIGGSIFAMAVSPDNASDATAFAGTSGGIYRSNNHGDNWYQRNNGLPQLTVRSLAVAPGDPNTLLAGTSFYEHMRFDTSVPIEADGNMQLSTDGGQTWRAVSGRLDRVNRVAFSPDFANDRTAFAMAGITGQHGYANGGVYRSTNGGNDWSAVLSNTVGSALAISPNFANDHTAWVVAQSGPLGSGILQTINGGNTWSLITNVVSVNILLASPNYAADQTLFASTTDGHLQKSIDGGQHWTPVLNHPISALAISPAYGASQTVYAAAKDNITSPGDLYRSVDGGATWQKLNTGIPATSSGQPLTFAVLNFAADGSVLAGVTYGNQAIDSAVYRSSDGGQTWQLLADGIRAVTLFDVASATSEIESERHGVLSFYAGTSSGAWQFDVAQHDPTEPGVWDGSSPHGGSVNVLAVSPNFVNDGIVLAGEHWLGRFGAQYGEGIFKSGDGGQSWHDSNNGMQNVPYPSGAIQGIAFSPGFAADKTVFAATWGGLFKSTDGGDNWQALPGSVFGAPGGYSAIAVAPNYPTSGHMLAVGGYGGLYRSTDFGVHWSYLGIPSFPAIAYSSNFAVDNTIFMAGGSVRKSTDGGLNWTPVLTAPVSAVAVSPQFGADHTLFATGDAFYKSINGGATWVSTTIGISNTMIGAPALSPAFATDHLIFVMTGNGLYRSDNGGLNWNLVPSPPSAAFTPVVISPGWPAQPYLLIGTSQGVYRSTDGGTTWVRMPGPMTLNASAIALSPDEAVWLTGTRNGVYASTDEGHTWSPFSQMSSYIGEIVISPGYNADETVFITTQCRGCTGASIHRTTDNGAVWQAVYSTEYLDSLAMSPQYATDHTLYAGGASRIVRSVDGGDHWSQVDPQQPVGLSLRFVALPPNYPADSTIFAAGYGFWRWLPGGTAWQPAASGLLSTTTVSAIAVAPNYTTSHTLLAITRFPTSNAIAGNVFRSDDGGVNWQRSDIGVPAVELRGMAFSPNYATDHTVYLTSIHQLYRSIDDGHRWTAIGAPSSRPELNNVIVNQAGQVIVTSSAGVLRYSTGFRDILIDGDFAAGSGWTSSTDVITSTQVAYTGSALRLGLDHGANNSIDSFTAQTVTIPISATLAQLNLRTYPVSSETQLVTPTQATRSSTATGDAQYATLAVSDTPSISRTLFWSLSNAQAWQLYSFDLKPYAGQTLVLRVGVLNDGQGGQTALYVDNASLITLGPAGRQVYLPIILKN